MIVFGPVPSRRLGRSIPEVELLTGYEGNAFASSGNPVKGLLAHGSPSDA